VRAKKRFLFGGEKGPLLECRTIDFGMR